MTDRSDSKAHVWLVAIPGRVKGTAARIGVKPRWCYSNPWDAPLARPVSALFGALNSAVECHLHTVEVAGSNPAAPTIESTTYGSLPKRFGSIW